MKYGVLNQCSPDYAGGTWQELDDLYSGGYVMARNAKAYLPQLPGESADRYGARLTAAGYVSYLGQIVDYFTSTLFSQDLAVTEAADADNPGTPGGQSDTDFYSAFSNNADLQGGAFAQVEKLVFRTALLKKKGILACDFPSIAEGANLVSLADEDQIGTRRAYCFELPIEQLIDWEYDKFGQFQYCVLKRVTNRREAPEDVRGSAVTEEFKVWRCTANAATWETYRVSRKADEQIADDRDLSIVDKGTTSFQAIPLVEFVVPDGLWIGNKIGTLAKEHFQRRTALVAAEYKSLVAIPYIKRGPEISAVGEAMPSETQQSPYRGANPVGQMNAKGWVEIGSGDELGFAEPAGTCYELIGTELKELKTEMFRVVHQMAASVDQTSGMQNRSGQSKKEDRSAESRVLGALGQLVRDHSKRVFATISVARGESVIWTPRGLDRYETDDRTALLAESVQVDLVAIPSTTFKKEYKTQLALRLVANAPAATQDTIRQEIIDGVQAEGDLKQLMDDAKNDALNDPDPNAVRAAAGVKTPMAPPAPPGMTKPAPSGKTSGASA